MAQQIINLGTAADDGTGTNLRAGGDMINDNFAELYAQDVALAAADAAMAANIAALQASVVTIDRFVVPLATQASWQATCTLACNASIAGNGPVEVYWPFPGTHTFARGVVTGGTGAGARVPGLVFRFAPGTRFLKDIVNWSTENAILQVQYASRVLIDATNVTLDGGQTVVVGPSGIVPLNGTGSDLIRLFSTSDWATIGGNWLNAADAWLRAIPFTSDPNPELMVRGIAYRPWVDHCNQFSVTNSSGETRAPRYLTLQGGYFQSMNSNKFAGRRYGGEGIWHLDNVYFDCLTPLEVDGPSNIVSRGNMYYGATQRCINVVMNNTNIADPANDHSADHLDIDDYGYNCAGGAYLKPDTQADAFVFPWKYAHMRMRMEGCDTPSGFGFDLEGDLQNVTAHLISSDWKRGTPFRYSMRGSGKRNNVHLIAEGTYDMAGQGSRRLFDISSATRRQGAYAVDGLKCEMRGVRGIGFERVIQFAGKAKGTASGATTDATGYAIGATVINLASAGTGSILAGDLVTFAGDPRAYRITVGDSSVANGGAITIAAPGLVAAIPTATTAITVVTKGTAASSTTSTAPLPIGSTSIPIAAAGTGSIADGDGILFSGDPIIYPVVTGLMDVAAGGTITIGDVVPQSYQQTSSAGLRTGSAAGATTNAAGYAIGATVITLAAAGTGFIATGSTITFAGDATVYTVSSGNTAVNAGGSITLSGGGLVAAIPAAATAITVVTTPTRTITIKPKALIRDLKISGDVEGSFSGVWFADGAEPAVENLDMTGLNCRIGGVGVSLSHVIGGKVQDNRIECTSAPALTLASSCSGVKVRDNALYLNGVPQNPTDSQNFGITSASRSTTTITATITHGQGSDFTVPTNARRMFSYFNSAGAEIGITSVTRTGATTADIVIASDTAGTLVTHGERRFSMNGLAIGDFGDRIYDNSGFAITLKPGAIAVA